MKFFLTLLTFFLIAPLYSLEKHQISGGTAYAENVYTKIVLRQPPFANVNLRPKVKTKSFEGSPYYQVRYLYQKNDWFKIGAELIHHKIYVVGNVPSYVQEFTITNGFNLLFCDQFFLLCSNKVSSLSLILGEGIVIAHPESRIRNNPFSEHGGFPWLDTDGYFVSGLSLLTGVNYSLQLARWFGIFFDSKATFSYASVPVYQGFADVSNIAFHFGGGIFLSF